VAVGNIPIGVAVDEATESVYVANLGYASASLDFTVSVLDGATCNAMHTSGCKHPTGTVEVGGGPIALAVNDKTGTVYVANSADGTLSVFGV
jgi:DNA-binding beta-propeller fold protein YncE